MVDIIDTTNADEYNRVMADLRRQIQELQEKQKELILAAEKQDEMISERKAIIASGLENDIKKLFEIGLPPLGCHNMNESQVCVVT